MAPKTLQTFSREEVATHNTSDNAWIIIDSLVYDISKFVKSHPGGQVVLRPYFGKDATTIFYELHR